MWLYKSVLNRAGDYLIDEKFNNLYSNKFQRSILSCTPFLHVNDQFKAKSNLLCPVTSNKIVRNFNIMFSFYWFFSGNNYALCVTSIIANYTCEWRKKESYWQHNKVEAITGSLSYYFRLLLSEWKLITVK